MKWFILTFLVVLTVVSCEEKKCRNSSECGDGKCCVTMSVLGFFGGGRCKNLAQDGESCRPYLNKNNKTPKTYFLHCPCASGLECYAENQLDLWDHNLKFNPKCVVPGRETTSRPLPTVDI